MLSEGSSGQVNYHFIRLFWVQLKVILLSSSVISDEFKPGITR